jgi:hypothetical protein
VLRECDPPALESVPSGRLNAEPGVRRWWRWHAEMCARIERVTRTDWEVSISYGQRSTAFYIVTRQFRDDQAAKAFADDAVRRIVTHHCKHHCDFDRCGEWVANLP